jgi:translation initiation factor IF-1
MERRRINQSASNHFQRPAVRLAIVLAASWMSVAYTVPSALADSDHSKKAERTQLREDAEALLKTNRTVLGRVQAVTSDQIKIDIGEVQPRFLPLKQAQQKGFAEIKEGDDLVVTVNGENLLVDYHPIDGESSAHTIIRGEVAQNLTVGHDTVVIKSDGKEQSFVIRSQARSKLAAIPIGAPALFLIDETNQIADASFTNVQAVKEAHRQPVAKPPIKGAHKQVEGMVAQPLDGNHIAVRIPNGHETRFEIRETVQPKIAALRKGDAVILLVDTENKVIDVAVPPPSH